MTFLRGVVLAALLLPAVRGYDVYTDQSGIYTVNWYPGLIPMRIKLPTSPALSDGTNYTTSVQAALQAWNAVLGTVQFTNQTTDTPKPAPAGTYVNGNGLNEIAMDSSIAGKAFGSGVLAITQTYTSGDRIAEADIIINTAFTWDSYRGSLHADQDIRRVILHELGHVLGLDHPDEAGQSVVAIMNSHVSGIDSLQADDIAGAQLLYGAPGFIPANDSFANAIPLVLSSGSLQVTGTNVAATEEAGEPNHAGATAPGHSVWWKWTAPSSASTTITTLGSNFDTVLGIYTGSTVSTLTAVGSNDDVQGGVIRTSTVTFNAVGGTTYSIAVDGWGRSSDGDPTTYTGAVKLNLDFAGSLTAAPSFTSQPAGQTVTAGSNVTFTATASGSPAPTFQWQKNGANIAGATSTSLSLVNVQAANAGTYTLIATNSAGSATSNAAVLTVNSSGPTPTIVSPLADFDGDGRAEPLWHNTGSSQIGAWTSAGTFLNFGPETGGWQVINVGDFDGDGRAEPLWRNTVSNQISTWTMAGMYINFGPETGGWQVVNVGDFDGDGRAEPLWRNTVSNQISTWTMAGMYINFGPETGGWQVVNVGDFDGDGRAEPLWRNTISHQVGVWTSTGTYFNFGPETGGWQVINVGDFDGDGRAEPLWRNTVSNQISTWTMAGGYINFGPESGGWQVIAVGDFDGDGRMEPVWRNTISNQISTWTMAGTYINFGPESGGWQVIN